MKIFGSIFTPEVSNNCSLVFCLFSSAEAVKYQAKDLRRNFVDRLKLLTTDGQGRSGLSKSAQGLDLVFVLDYSASVGKKNFRKAIAFTKSMINEFGLSETSEGTHVAVIVFGSEPKLIFNLMSEKVWKKHIAIEEIGKFLPFADQVTRSIQENSKPGLFVRLELA